MPSRTASPILANRIAAGGDGVEHAFFAMKVPAAAKNNNQE